MLQNPIILFKKIISEEALNKKYLENVLVCHSDALIKFSLWSRKTFHVCFCMHKWILSSYAFISLEQHKIYALMHISSLLQAKEDSENILHTIITCMVCAWMSEKEKQARINEK